jgi:hypothetical protein
VIGLIETTSPDKCSKSTEMEVTSIASHSSVIMTALNELIDCKPLEPKNRPSIDEDEDEDGCLTTGCN